jgi:hypothetical protein
MTSAPFQPRRSGSQKRQRQRAVKVALTDAERAQIEAAAEAAGLSLGGYARQVLLGTPTPRTRRRPAADREVLSRLRGDLGRATGNLNQLLRLAHQWHLPSAGSVEQCVAEVRAVAEQVGEAVRDR